MIVSVLERIRTIGFFDSNRCFHITPYVHDFPYMEHAPVINTLCENASELNM